jgi:hypothetical protein
VRKESLKVYADQVEDGSWQEGVFVFPTKDVVVRFNRPGYRVDREFAAGAITGVTASDFHGVLTIAFQPEGYSSQTVQNVMTIKASHLVEPPSHIASEMQSRLGLSEGDEV